MKTILYDPHKGHRKKLNLISIRVRILESRKPLNRLCGQGSLLVAQATATHMPCELWLHYCIEKYAPRTNWGRGGRHSESAQSVLLQCSAKLCS
jgi:hypothetical protein